MKGALLKDNPILMHLWVNLRNRARKVTDVAATGLCGLSFFSGVTALCHLRVISAVCLIVFRFEW